MSFGLVSNSLALACNLPHFRAIPPPIQTSKSDVNRVTVHYSGDIRISQRPIRIIEITKGSIRVENTVLRADKIFYYPDGGTDSDGVSHLPLSGSAYGSVSLTNPLGGMTADNLNFDLNEKSGDAKNANIRLPGIQAQSGFVDFSDEQVSLSNVTLRDDHRHPFATVSASQVYIRPGDSAVASSVSYRLFGTRLFGLKHQTIRLNNELSGSSIPNVSYDQRYGFSAAWYPAFIIAPQTALSLNANFSQRAYPSESASLVKSFRQGNLVPLGLPSEFGTRFTDSYFDNPSVRYPLQETDSISADRLNFGIGSRWNFSPSDRLQNDSYSEPYLIATEMGGRSRLGGIHGYQLFEDLIPKSGLHQFRTAGNFSIHPNVIALSKSSFLRMRIDGFETFGYGSYGWLRGSIGPTFHPNRNFRFGIAAFSTLVAGSARLIDDEPYQRSGFDMRMDFSLGPRNISLLQRYDLDRHRLYGTGVYLGQTAGIFEPFVLYDTFPHRLIFGFELRVDSWARSLTRNGPLQQKPDLSTTEK